MKRIITTPFDRERIPPRQNLIFLPLIWLICLVGTASGRLKIKKERMKGLKPPFIVLGTHMAFSDFLVTPLALFPYRANYISELEGFENYGEWLYRQLGCLGTRKFVNDISLIRNIKNVIKRKDIIVLYPEARYANVGTSSKIPAATGKLLKMLKVPVVAINMRGNYLQSPIWNLAKRKGARLSATITQIFTAEELERASVDDVNNKLAKYLAFDEYAWQYESKMRIDYAKRAEGLEVVLYQCPCCKSEFKMQSRGAELYCGTCGARWTMNVYGRMEQVSGGSLIDENVDFAHIPNWYEWQRANVKKEIDNGNYRLITEVRIESLPNAINFIDLGKGMLRHDENGFVLTFTYYGENEPKSLAFEPDIMPSVHTECNYRGYKGECITLSTMDNTYFIYPAGEGFNNVKIQFATEYLFEKSRNLIDNTC